MSLRPLGYQCNLPYAQLFRNGLQKRYNSLSQFSSFTRSHNSRPTHSRSTTNPHHAHGASFSLGSLLSALLGPTHTFRDHRKRYSTQQCGHETSVSKYSELCAHCGGKTTKRMRKLAEPGNPSSGWHCKPCLRNIRIYGHLPNEEQLAAINQRRRMIRSGEASKTSPCKHCGTMTAPRSCRKFIDPSNPSAGFHCRSCVRHTRIHGHLPTEQDLATARYRKSIRNRQASVSASRNNAPDISENDIAAARRSESPGSSDPTKQKQSRDPHPCIHCGDVTTSNSKRRLVEPRNPAAGYYCQPCTRCLLETDALPSSTQLEALKRFRKKRSKSNPRDLNSPCRHCGDITAPSSKRRLVEAKKPDSGYYCRACADCLIETSELPSEMRLAARRAREQVRLKNLEASRSQGSQVSFLSLEGNSTVRDAHTGKPGQTCAH
ncbi:hypothetical protein N7475_009371 [Penicillium sp. IBT 31633x]|nr:hypothetical protein N7475_009371 [Penicillium sp. IBT 31633x]